jgi:hypothetical protein
VALMALAVPAVGLAQTSEIQRQRDLEQAHSVVQKAGLGTLAVTGALGLVLFANKPTVFGDGLCSTGDGIMGEYGCGPGLALTHFGFAVASLGIFVASEVLAAKMDPSPYSVGDQRRQDAMNAIRWTEVGLYAVQPVLGLISAHPGLIGIPASARADLSRVMRTIHLGVGLGIAATYSVNAAFQW